jgi:hypothetical protein
MTEAITLTRIDFDGLENSISAAIVKEDLGTFVGDDKLTAHGKVSAFIKAMKPEKRYLGYDGDIYPIYVLKTIYLQ